MYGKEQPTELSWTPEARERLERIPRFARGMVTRYGMVKALGDVAYDEERAPLLGGMQMPGPREYSEQTAREIDVAVRDIVSAAHAKALAILQRDRAVLERGAKLLLEKETLAETELAALKSQPAAGGAA